MTNVDRTLVVPALAAWAGAVLPARWALPCLVAVAVALGAAVVLDRRRWGAALLVLIPAAVSMVGVAVRSSSLTGGPVAALARARAPAVVDAVVVTDPAPRAGAVVGARRLADAVVLRVRAERVTSGGRTWLVRVPLTVVAHGPPWRRALPGERLRVGGQLAPSSGPTAASLYAETDPVRLVRAGPLGRLAGRLRAGLRSAVAHLPAAERGLLPGLVVGDTSGLDPALREEFRRTGLTHLVAVSGTNCAVVLAAALAAARAARLGLRTSAVAAGACLAVFVVVARPSPSVLRAATMGALVLFATVTGRERDGLRVLCGGVLVLLLADPLLARSPGFALSCAATAGLLVLAPPWRDRLATRWPRPLASAVAVPLAAQVACAPVLAALAAGISLVAVPANLLAMPAVGPATILGVLAALLAQVHLPFARVVARLAAIPAAWLVAVAGHGAALPGSRLPWPSGVPGALSLAAAGLFGYRLLTQRRPRRLLASATAGALVAAGLVHAVAPAWPPPGWRVVVCDVGQGDAIVVRGSPAAVVVDAGPDPAAADTCLRDLGVRRIAALVLTHLHADHVEGMPGVLRRRQVGEVVLGPLDEPVEELDRVRTWAAEHRLPLRRAAAGEHWAAGAVEVDVLGPRTAFRGTASDPNNSSLLLRIRTGGMTILLTGDVEQDAQQAALDSGRPLDADALKVPHHGSNRQVRAFLDRTGARVGVVSVGRDNPYGHPAPETLAALAERGIRPFRTDRDGDVALATRAGTLTAVPRRRTRLFASRAVAPPPVSPRFWCPVPPSRAPPPASAWTGSARPPRAGRAVRLGLCPPPPPPLALCPPPPPPLALCPPARAARTVSAGPRRSHRPAAPVRDHCGPASRTRPERPR